MPAPQENDTIDLGSFKMEQHVQRAFETAVRLAAPDPVNAGNLLEAVLMDRGSSKAYEMISQLIPAKVPMLKQIKQRVTVLAVSSALKKSFDTAIAALADQIMWGRHLIAVALLAADETALLGLTRQANTTLAALQDAWFRFVTEDPVPTSAADWERWWRNANVPLPDERASSEKPRIKYWIFQATPERFDLNANLIAGKQDRWHANQHAGDILKGDIVFFWQSGINRGIFGWGEVVSENAYASDIDQKTSVDVFYRLKFSTPIPFEQIRELSPMRAHPLLSGSPQETNFKLDLIQASALWRLISETPLPPEPPAGTSDHEYVFEMQFRPLSDMWTTEDRLGYVFYATAIADTILRGRIIPPISMSIQAPWGQGKTSLMRMIKNRLEAGDDAPASKAKKGYIRPSPGLPPTLGSMLRWHSQEQHRATTNMLGVGANDNTAIPTVWFNPLYYHKSDQVWAGMAHAILHQLSDKLGARQARFWFLLQLKRLNIEALLKDVRWFVLEKFLPFLIGYLVLTLAMFFIGPEVQKSLVATTKMSFLKNLHPASIPPLLALLHWIGWDKFRFKSWQIQDKFEHYISEPDYQSQQGLLWLVDQDMEHALELLVGANPIAIFIDDLDRCQPEVVSEVIYAINQFMSVTGRKIIFIIGMDSGMVAEALENHHRRFHKNIKDSQGFGWRFLEKFIQVPFMIPRISEPVTRDFMSEFVGDRPAEDQKAANQTEIEQMIDSAVSGEALGDAVDRVLSMPNSPGKTALMEKASKKVVKTLNDPRSEEVKRMVDIAIQELEYNPRSIKRFVNTARLLYTVWTGSGRWRAPGVDPLTLIVHAAHLLLNWPDIVSWLQKLNGNGPVSQVDSDDPSLSHFDVLSKEALAAQDFAAWRNWVKNRYGDEGEVLINAAFYTFIRRIAAGEEHLGTVFKAALY